MKLMETRGVFSPGYVMFQVTFWFTLGLVLVSLVLVWFGFGLRTKKNTQFTTKNFSIQKVLLFIQYLYFINQFYFYVYFCIKPISSKTMKKIWNNLSVFVQSSTNLIEKDKNVPFYHYFVQLMSKRNDFLTIRWNILVQMFGDFTFDPQ